jgi:hypothetical protein
MRSLATRAVVALVVLIASCFTLLWPRQSHAGLLTFNFDPNGPFITTMGGTLSYTRITGDFQSTATPSTYSSSNLFGSPFSFSGSPQLSIDFTVNADGTFRQNGTGFDLNGTLSTSSFTISGTLLTGDITAFGAQPAGPPTRIFNALFTITGGTLIGISPTQFQIGETGGIELDAENVTSGTLGDFSASFSGSSRDFGGAIVGAAIPEPSALTLAATGFGIFLLFRFLGGLSARRQW